MPKILNLIFYWNSDIYVVASVLFEHILYIPYIYEDGAVGTTRDLGPAVLVLFVFFLL